MTPTKESIHRKDQEDKLGYCPECDHEYTEAQIEGIDYDRAPVPYISECPKCHTEAERILYWCDREIDEPLHDPKDCEKYHRD